MTEKKLFSPDDTGQSIIQFQYQISCQLLDIHLTGLSDEEYRWRPAAQGLHVRNDSGIWRADWPESESYDIGPPSIAWLTWHIIFWGPWSWTIRSEKNAAEIGYCRFLFASQKGESLRP